jgi:hypothetical protein
MHARIHAFTGVIIPSVFIYERLHLLQAIVFITCVVVYIKRYMHAFMHFCIYAFTHSCICTFMHLHIYAFAHLCIYSFAHLCIYTFMHLNIYAYTHLFIYAFMQIFIHYRSDHTPHRANYRRRQC